MEQTIISNTNTSRNLPNHTTSEIERERERERDRDSIRSAVVGVQREREEREREQREVDREMLASVLRIVSTLGGQLDQVTHFTHT